VDVASNGIARSELQVRDAPGFLPHAPLAHPAHRTMPNGSAPLDGA
jgi:hypothetical protein